MKKLSPLLRRTIILSCIGILLSGCNYYYDKTLGAQDSNEVSTNEERSQVSFDIVRSQVLIPKCISCHGSSGGINLETHDAVIKNLAAIENSIFVKRSMPKTGFLTLDEMNLLRAWIKAGAPFDSAEPTPSDPSQPTVPPVVNNPNETPVPQPSPRPNPPAMGNPGPPISEEQLTYELVRKEVFVPSCVRCHGNSAGVRLDSYQKIKSQISAIKRATLIDRSMPQDGPLSARQEKLLSDWIKKGAPQFGSSRPDPEQPPRPPEPPSVPEPEDPPPTNEPEPGQPPTIPLGPTFTAIKENIFLKRCTTCHSETGSGKRIPLATKEDLLNSPLELVIPKNSDESGLVLAITRTDDKRMPPPPRKSLTEDEINAIKLWIQNGAKD